MSVRRVVIGPVAIAPVPIARFAAVLVAAMSVSAQMPAGAADLYGPNSYVERERDEDPRYGDIYRHPPSPAPRYAAPYVPEPSYDRPPPSYRDEQGYLRPMEPRLEPRFAPGPRQVRCLPHDVIRDRLERRGWHQFRDIALEGEIAIVHARAADGRRFELGIDRCTGQLVEARLIHRRAAQVRPRQWDRRPYAGY